MNENAARIGHFIQAGQDAQRAVDQAIARADLVARVARLKRELVAIRLQRDDAVTDAQLRLGMAQLSLEDFDRKHRV